MTISSYFSPASSSLATGTSTTQEGFDTALQEASKPFESAQEIAKKERTKREEEIKTFFDEMNKSGGAMNYLVKLNLEKLEKQVKEKEAELRTAYGVDDPKSSLTAEQKTAALEAIAKALDEYRKQLMKELQERSAHDKAQQLIRQNPYGLATM